MRPLMAARVASQADSSPLAATITSSRTRPEAGRAAAAIEPRRRDGQGGADRPGAEPGAEQQCRFGQHHRRQPRPVVADGAQQRELAPALGHVAEHHRGQAERPEQQAEAAERLERRQVGVLDAVERGQPLAGAHRVHPEIVELALEDAGERRRLRPRCWTAGPRPGRTGSPAAPGTRA